MASKHATEEHEGYTHDGTKFDIEIRTESKEDDFYNYDKIIEVNVELEHTIDGIMFKSLRQLFISVRNMCECERFVSTESGR